MHRLRRLLAAVTMVACGGTLAGEDRLVVVTGYHANVTEPYRQAFVAAHPEVDVTILWRESRAAIDSIESREAGGADVYWGASPANFRRLAAAGRLAPLGAEIGALPERIGDFPLVASDRSSTAFELAGYGFIVNRGLCQDNQLTPPADWADLERAEYAGHLLLPVPSRQGTARLPYEILLQAYGWDEGWRRIARIVGNGQLLPPDVSSLSDAVAKGSKAIGVSIDFYARDTLDGDDNVGFIYPRLAAYSVAEVGVLTDAPNPELAREFVRFVLSEQGQQILTTKGIERLPIHPEVYRKARLAYNPYALDQARPVAYSLELAGKREGLLAALFDATLTDQHELLVATLHTLREAERVAGSDSRARADLDRARQLIGAPPLTAAAANDDAMRQRFPLGGAEQWDATARQQYAAWQQQAAAQLREAASIATAIKDRTR
ncbi:MAG: extracellular solute-binding protein [Gammaproteobacteria bacterium]|nr:extracellular solute-binding protein [Gammaproteobacteria bacterium]